MAGHKSQISGYMSNLWQVLFASFIQLFIRLFHSGRTKDAEPFPQTQPEQRSGGDPSPSLPFHNPPSATTSTTPSLCVPIQVPVSDTNNKSDRTDLNLYHEDPKEHQDQQHPSSSPYPGFSLQDDEAMPSAKKRAGRKRGGGVKANTASSGQSNNQKSATQPPAPLSASTNTAPADQRDTKPINYLPTNDQKPSGAKKGPKINGNRGPSSPTKPNAADNKKENVAPLHDDAATGSVGAQSPLGAKPLNVASNKPELQISGARRNHVTPIVTTSTQSLADQNPYAANHSVEHLGSVADRLTLDDVPESKARTDRTLTDATNAAEASALPIPVTVVDPRVPLQQPKFPMTDLRPAPNLPGLIEPKTEEERIEREYHLKYMREALDMGNLALNTNETPVGCVLVYRGRTIAKGMNATNITRNGTRHAEFMALSALLSRREKGDVREVNISPALDDASWGDVEPRDGHIYPYGQKLHPAPVVDRSIISECVLYVTVEPCVMCASLLRQLGIKKVYFGAVNDKFGGTGGVFRIHMNSKPVTRPEDRPYQNGYGPHDVNRISKGRAIQIPRHEEDGDGGNVESGYPVEGGYLRDDAVSLLRRFYVQENGRAPQPRKKEGRAARLFAMEGQVKTGGSASELSDAATVPGTPVDAEATIDDREKLHRPD